MYIPKPFEIKDEQKVFNIIEANSFATLFSLHMGSPSATHLPLILDRKNNVLVGHFARANSQWKDIDTQDVLAVFHGPHTYVSPAWYETELAVPTWNYVAAHVYGKAELINNQQELIESLQELVNKYEDENSLYRLNVLDSKYVEGLSKGVVGFKIHIQKVEGKAKLSQNKSEDIQKKVIQHLEQSVSEDSRQIAKLMRGQ
ncbi:PaiB family negative transcriptional regulator [Bacillus oleivorans]|uniref:PaiB family negative transcriptional regulator n=1 Tax=Bacillus oleivorans TaxID=1448271 RepID=A0A285CRX6_9BACI|nr:FMN-binding negative transcriptional regulator [Bacillus oleivorans]SNX70339.1 PaiB family negative transcriptional regulator [Bacillus oleivorans]